MKYVFLGYSIPLNCVFRHFSATTGVRDVARSQKMAENRNRATFTGAQCTGAAEVMRTRQERYIQASLFIHFGIPPPIGDWSKNPGKVITPLPVPAKIILGTRDHTKLHSA